MESANDVVGIVAVSSGECQRAHRHTRRYRRGSYEAAEELVREEPASGCEDDAVVIGHVEELRRQRPPELLVERRLASRLDRDAVIGPQAKDELARWLDETKGSIDHAATQAQLLAASFAAEPEQLRPLLDNPDVDLEQLVGLAATGPKWQLTVDDQGAGKYVIGVVTPGPPKPARAR